MRQQDTCQQETLSPFNFFVGIAKERNQGVLERNRILLEASILKKTGQHKWIFYDLNDFSYALTLSGVWKKLGLHFVFLLLNKAYEENKICGSLRI